MKDKICKVGIIGTGGRGGGFAHLIGLRNDVQITALCDPNHVRMEAFSKKINGNPNLYTDVDEMLKKEKLDGIIITSPDYCHEANAVAALGKGANVLIDKPLATTVKGCKNIISAAKKAGKIAMMGFNLRHDPTLKRLKKIVEDGILGKVFLIENREFYDGGRTYMARWNRKYELCGGLWIHKGSHDFDVFQWLLNFPKPSRVSSVAGINVFTPENIPFKIEKGTKVGPTCHECAYNKICPDVHMYAEEAGWDEKASKVDNYSKDLCMYCSDKDVHDNGIAIVEYENGARASHMECFVTSISDRLYTVVGDRGQAEVSLHNRTILVRPRWTRETVSYQIPEATGGHGGADPGILGAFVKILKGESDVTSTLEHGMYSTAVGQAAEISRREERMVYISELMK